MRLEDLQRKIRSRPFEPFRMHLSAGANYEVRHPELILLGRRSMVLGIPRSPEETFYKHLVDIDFMHIVRMEPIESVSPRSANGDA